VKIREGPAKRALSHGYEGADPCTPAPMADIILVAVTLAFIGICVAYVNWCDRIIGPDPTVDPADRSQSADELDGPLVESSVTAGSAA
jgi:hypothetical protein